MTVRNKIEKNWACLKKYIMKDIYLQKKGTKLLKGKLSKKQSLAQFLPCH